VYLEFSNSRPIGPPFEATVVAPQNFETTYGSAGLVTFELPSGGRATLQGILVRNYASGERILVQEFRTPILGIRRYEIATSSDVRLLATGQ